MDECDIEKFAKILNALHVMFGDGQELSAPKVELYYQVLNDYPLSEVSEAAASLLKTWKYPTKMPLPSHFISEIEKSNGKKSLVAWMEIVEAMKKPPEMQVIKDKNTAKVIQSMGGIDRLSLVDFDDLHWSQREFERRYNSIQKDDFTRINPPENIKKLLDGIG